MKEGKKDDLNVQQYKVMTSLLLSRLHTLLKNEDFMKWLALYLRVLNIENVLETYNPITSKFEEFWCAFVCSKMNLTPVVFLFSMADIIFPHGKGLKNVLKGNKAFYS